MKFAKLNTHEYTPYTVTENLKSNCTQKLKCYCPVQNLGMPKICLFGKMLQLLLENFIRHLPTNMKKDKTATMHDT